jgi:hypothetical protein
MMDLSQGGVAHYRLIKQSAYELNMRETEGTYQI